MWAKEYILCLLFWDFTTGIPVTTQDKKIVCFYSGWSSDTSGPGILSLRDLDPGLCTHLIYMYATLDDNDNIRHHHVFSDWDKGHSKFSSPTSYKKNPVRLVAVGKGSSSKLSAIAADSERRRKFARNSVEFLRTNKLSGINLSWHHPGLGSSDDKVNYVLLLQALREEFEQESDATGKSSLLISIDVPHNIKVLDVGFDIHSLSKYLDFMNVFTFNYRSPAEEEISHSASLYPSGRNNRLQNHIDSTVKYYLGLGVDREKLILGMPTYGNTLLVYKSDNSTDGVIDDGFGFEETISKAEGILPYYEICKLVKSGTLQIENPPSISEGPYARHGNFLVGFDDTRSVTLKAQYAAQEDLGGLMFWTIDYDDFSGDCHGKKFPLIESGKEEFLTSVKLQLKKSNHVQGGPQRPWFTHTSSKHIPEPSISPANFTGPAETNITDSFMKRSAQSDSPAEAGGSNTLNQRDSERQCILDQLVNFVKRIGGVSMLERLLNIPARSYNRGPLISSLRTYASSDYGPTVTSLTVTSPPLIVRKAPTPIVLTNFTINIDKINIDSSMLRAFPSRIPV